MKLFLGQWDCMRIMAVSNPTENAGRRSRTDAGLRRRRGGAAVDGRNDDSLSKLGRSLTICWPGASLNSPPTLAGSPACIISRAAVCCLPIYSTQYLKCENTFLVLGCCCCSWRASKTYSRSTSGISFSLEKFLHLFFVFVFFVFCCFWG